MPIREHLFISYAWEDGALAEWLTLKLTSEGYRVWCDRFKMLGGERWPEDIDVAIKTQTFRMLHLVSQYSLHKENPSKERQLALTLSKERKEDFLLPLNVDGTRPSDLPWQISDINYINFQNWSDGLRQLLKKLDTINAPKPLAQDGRRIAAETFLPTDAVIERPEILQSNCLPFIQVPAIVKRFRLSTPLTKEEEDQLSQRWAFYRVDGQKLLAFSSPPQQMPSTVRVRQDGGALWKDVAEIDEINSLNIVTSLLKKSLTVKCIEKGMKLRQDGGLLYFPIGLLEKDRIKYFSYKGRMTRVNVIGERKARGVKVRYHLAVAFWVRRDVIDGFVMMTKIRLYLVDSIGQPLEAKIALNKRKKIAKSWWNHQWLSRQMAIRSFLADGGESIVMGSDLKEQLILAIDPIQGEVSLSINEAFLRPLGVKLRAMQPAELDELEDDNSNLEDA
jgi:hypothetical protein